MQKKFSSGKSYFSILGIIIVAIIAIAAGFYFGAPKKSPEEALKNVSVATVLPQARTVAPFSLTDNKGQPFTNASLQGHWTFMFFGFTNCGYICPTTMSELSKVFQILKQDNIAEPQYYLVSIDPERDNVARMNTFVTTFNKNFKGATGSLAAIEKLTKAMNVVYLKVMPRATSQEANYDIDHSGAIMLLNPQGHLVAIFSMPHQAQKIASDYALISEYYDK